MNHIKPISGYSDHFQTSFIFVEFNKKKRNLIIDTGGYSSL